MHLKSITLKGFKSFAQPTTLVLEPGITCVVGPNGSGKSNVVDALAWVMGEQGAKTLRGGKMEDVIFAGTATKGPLGRAEVQLTIDNADGALPIEYAEVTISRVLFRNGASEYAINGESCRLLDVQELLSDTGLGREMHVIVGQGQLDNVLKANPVERRAFVEEAAGILKYRRRKEKTERKLDAMQVNLVRLQDLTAELRRNLKPLGRQADVARQAQQIGSIAREAKAKLYAFQIRALQQQLELDSKSENERRAESSYAQSQLSSTRSAIQDLETQLVSSELDQLRQRLFGYESAESKLRSLQNLAQQRVSLLGQQEFSSREIEVSDLTAQLAMAEGELQNLESEFEEIAESLVQREEAREAASAALANFEAELLRQRSSIEAAERNQARLQSLVSIAESKLDGLSAQLAKVAETKVEIAARIAQLDLEKREIAPESEDLSDSDLRESFDKAQNKESQAREKLEAAREELHRAERERDAVAARHSALGLSLEQNDGSQDVRKAKLSGIKGLLAESISIEKGYETAIAVALGTLADAIVVESKEQAIAALNYLKTEGLGRAEFLISKPQGKTPADPTLPGLVSASSVVSAPDAVIKVLSGIYIAESLEKALAAIEAGSLGNISVITKAGDFVSESVVRGGGTKQPSNLELSAERDAANSRLVELAKDIEKLTEALEIAKENLTTSGIQVRDALATLQQHDAELAARAERAGRLIAQIDSANVEISRLDRDSETLLSNQVKVQAELAEAKQELADLPPVATLAANEAERSSLTVALDAARSQELELRVLAGTLSERRINASKMVATTKGRLNEANAAAERDRAINAQKVLQVESATQALSQLPSAIALTEKLAGAIRVKVRDLEAQRIQRTERLSQLRSQAAVLETRLLELNQGVHEVEMRNHELKLNMANLTERVSSELSLDLTILLEEFPVNEETREELEKSLRQAEAKLSQLGSFNPLALEEFAALEERHKYLAEQLEDLAKARADLMGIIKDLDSKMQSIFAAAFEDTKREFEKIFPILFPGGTGSISLTEPDDLLATGVEVSVRPAGKRIERMSLLSGGERSLAAVALLIAIFKARPSPFYVLDEVEAALDDANLGRLLQVVETLRQSSQLIIVTHQKRTMEIADALYGVSMRQDGMSAVVGQKLEKSA
ncbi:MAG: chromosome segregation protein SMC [Aquiluna sp.]|nr:chromosome segregation protein SMC [Aquiluna sp.]MCF8545306.1 chromosome segregation protein SMC [Aquiluna sp.]